jgi:branched-chain amino acid transport system substrate-binding protein
MKRLLFGTLVLLSAAVAADDRRPEKPKPAAAGQPRPEGERYRYANRPDALFPYGEQTIHKDAFAVPLEFRGTGRELPEPAVDRVRIGFIGPLLAEDRPILAPGQRPGHAGEAKTVFGRSLLRGATLAMDEANRAGGYKGKPFELVRRTDLVQWGQTSNELVQFTYADNVWAVLSSVDSNHNHVLSRVSLKTEIPIVSAGSTDQTLTEHAIPWLARCINDDRQNAYEVLNYLFRVKGYHRVVVLRVNERDGRVGVMELMKGARRLGHPVLMELRFRPGDTDFREPLQRLRELPAQALVIWGNPGEAGRIVRQMRELGMKHEVVGFDRLAHPLFLKAAGDAAEGVVVAATMNPERNEPSWQAFRRTYRERHGEEPDAFAAHGYDGMRLIVESVRRGGLNRAKIRDAIFGLPTFPGVTGEIVFDSTHNDISRAWLARVEQGRFRYFRPPDWERVAHPRAMIASRARR